MNIFEHDLRRHLGSDSTIHDLVGQVIRPKVLGKNDGRRGITYTIIYGRPVQTLDGANGITHYSLQVDCWGETDKIARDIARAVRARMEQPAASSDTDRPLFTSLVTDYPLFDEHEPETDRHRRSLGISCRHDENVTP